MDETRKAFEQWVYENAEVDKPQSIESFTKWVLRYDTKEGRYKEDSIQLAWEAWKTALVKRNTSWLGYDFEPGDSPKSKRIFKNICKWVREEKWRDRQKREKE